MQKILFLDFDGTIITSNISEYILETYTDERWLYYHNLLVEKKMSQVDVAIGQHSLIRTPFQTILKDIDSKILVRDNFINLITFAKQNSISLQIVSGGMDFVIKYILEKLGIHDIEITSIQLNQREDFSLEVLFPKNFDEKIEDFKLDRVLFYKKQGYYIYYIGDSFSDFDACLEANMIFSVKSTSLSDFCKERGLQYLDFSDFNEIINYLENN